MKKILFLSVVLFSILLHAGNYAVFLTHPENAALCSNMVRELKRRGFKETLLISGNPVKNEELDPKLKSFAKLSDQDSFLLFLSGDAVLQNSRKLADFLKVLKAQKTLLIASDRHFLVLLKELGPLCRVAWGGGCRFGEIFIRQCCEKNSNFPDAAKAAGDQIASEGSSLSRLPYLFFEKSLMKYPFNELGFKQEQRLLGNAAFKKAEEKNPDGKRKMTSAELAHYNQIRSAVRQIPYAGVITQRILEITVRRNLSGRVQIHEEFFICNQTGVSDLTYFRVKQGYINGVRLFFPNGTMASDTVKFKNKRIMNVRLNGLEPGTLIQRDYTLEIAGQQAIRVFNTSITLQQKYPVLETLLSLRTEGPNAHAKLYHISAEKIVRDGKPFIRTKSIPVYSPLPFDDDKARHTAVFRVTSFSNWNEVNRTMWNAVAPAMVLDGVSKQVLEKLTKPHKTKAEKLRAVYDYLCRIRYLTEPVGIAAVRPRTPGIMIRERFGDCKDKANALVMMARALGIEACHVLLNRGGDCDLKYPSWQFNHMIVFIPKLEGYPDGLWLDATDGVMPFGSLPSGDEGRLGMILYSANRHEFRKVHAERFENTVTQELKLKVDPEKRTASGTALFRYTGLSGSGMRQRISRMDPLQRDYQIRSLLAETGDFFELKKCHIINIAAADRPFILNAEITTPSGNFSLDRIELPGGFGRYFLMKQRPFPIKLFKGAPLRYIQITTLEGMKFKPCKWSGSAAGVEMKIETTENKRVAEINIKSPVILPADYPKLRKLVQDFTARFR